MCLSVCLPTCLSIYLSMYLLNLSLSLSLFLSLSVSVCVFVCLSIYIYHIIFIGSKDWWLRTQTLGPHSEFDYKLFLGKLFKFLGISFLIHKKMIIEEPALEFSNYMQAHRTVPSVMSTDMCYFGSLFCLLI